MPVFELECPKCGQIYEHILFKTTDCIPQQACDGCGCPLERRVSKPNFSLKGCGWAKDNYSSNKEPTNGVS